MAPALAQAQSAAPAPTDQAAPPAADQSAPATAAPADQSAPAAAPQTDPSSNSTSATQEAAPTTASADGVTKVGGKYMKDGRKATKPEIAEFKKTEKAKQE